MELRINKDKITKIIIRDRKDFGFSWLPKKVEKSFFGIFSETFHEGYYWEGKYDTSHIVISKEDLEKGWKSLEDLGDGILRERVHVEIFINTELVHIEYFENLTAASSYANVFTPQGKFEIIKK